jgi:plastocyanin
MTNQTPKRSNTAWYIAAVLIIIVIIASSGLTYQYTKPNSPSPSPTSSVSPTGSPSAGSVTISIYAGEVSLSSSIYGFGSTESNITSPGPTFTVKLGTTVTVDFTNAGTMNHNWALVTEKTSGNTNLAFSKAQIASASYAVSPGGKGSTTFVANKVGTYYYICQVDAHVALGMWGTFIVTP